MSMVMNFASLSSRSADECLSRGVTRCPEKLFRFITVHVVGTAKDAHSYYVTD